MTDNQSTWQPHSALSMQHSHWSNQDDHAPFSIHIMVGLFITTVGVVALVGNVLVVVTCVRYKDLRTRSNILIINLAVGDLLMCVIDFPLLAIASFLQGWPFGFVVCRLYAFLTATAGLVTINTLGVISADRYWAVVWRASPRQQLPKYVTGLIVLGVWIYAISWAICPILGWGDYVLDGIGTTCTFDYLTRSWTNRSFVIAMVFGNFVVPFVMMLFSYTKIWMAVCNVKRGLQEHQGRVIVGKAKSRNHKQSITSDLKGDYSSIYSDNGCIRKLYKISDGQNERLDFLSKSKTLIHDGKADKDVSFDSQDEEKDKKISVTVNPLRSQHKDFIIFSFKNRNPNNNLDNTTLNHLINGRKKGVSEEHDKCQIYSFPGVGSNAAKETNHSKDNRQTRQQYYLVRSSKYPTSRNDSINDSSRNCSDSNKKNAKISLSSYQKVISDKLFLKQHRYRLHCEYKTMKIIMYLLLAFIISWFPYVVVSMMGLFGDASRITYLTSVFPSLVAKSSMVFNPILYSISHPKVRKRIVHLFFCYDRHHHHSSPNGADAGNSSLRQGQGPFSSSVSCSR